jgi:hypothetical protein
MLLQLKTRIIQTHGSQIVAARAIGIDETRLSRIIRGHIRPRADERDKLIAAFGAAALRPTRTDPARPELG